VVKYVENFEELMAREAKRKKCDGVICGHIHKAAVKKIEGIEYYNDGDWVESLTALVETKKGKLELVDWHKKPLS
jgi:UDP-2,3-diacylglucosamine pyrophosphatase LpxH